MNFSLCWATHWLFTPLRIKAPVLTITRKALPELAPGSLSNLTSHSGFLVVSASGPLHLLLFLPGKLSSIQMLSYDFILISNQCHFCREANLDHKTSNINLPPTSLFLVSAWCLYTMLIIYVTWSMSVFPTWIWVPEDRDLCNQSPLSSPQYLQQCLTHSSNSINIYWLNFLQATSICQLHSHIKFTVWFLTLQRSLGNYEPPWNGSYVSHDWGIVDRECNLSHLFQIKPKHS